MASLAVAPPRAMPGLLAGNRAACAVLLLAAIALRLPHLGDPSYMIDEEFYLVAGDKLLHGMLPFVDVWDRKPVGLFLLYALAAAFGSWAIWAYQLMALGCAAATAMVIQRIAVPMAGMRGGVMAGLLYLVWIELAEGGGGQSPIFYNLPMAAAAWAVLTAGDTQDRRRHRVLGSTAMALAGIAIQIKYTAVFEALFLGLVLSWWALLREGAPTVALRRIGAMAAIALLPTLLALTCYAAIGQASLFIFSNFISIFLRSATPGVMIGDRVEMVFMLLAPFVVCIAASLWRLHARNDLRTVRWRLVTTGWCAAALLGLFSVGTLYLHYLLPVFLPFSVASAPIFGRRKIGPIFALFAVSLPALNLHYPDFERTAHHRQQIAVLTALIPREVDRQCMQMFDGPPILYWTSHACTVSRFVFPDHLSAANEQNAIGTDTVLALRAILQRRPLVITIGIPDIRARNQRTYPVLYAALADKYRLAGKAPFDGRDIEVWVRADRAHTP